MGELHFGESIKQTPNLTQAIISVMNEIDGIEKAMTVGAGNNTYKGVSDRDVKIKIGRAMAKHGLVLMPIGVTPKTAIDRYPEMYNGKETGKMKQQVNTEVVTRYKLSHTSGEFDILEGFGQGVDSQDKAAGKATTYALKYTLLYLFLVPTGDIDDSDRTHSDEIEVPVKSPDLKPTPSPEATVAKPETAKPAKAVKAPVEKKPEVETPATTGQAGSAIAPSKEFTDEKVDHPDKERRDKAKLLFKSIPDPEVLKYLVKELNERKYSTVATFLNAAPIEQVLSVYTALAPKK